MSEKTKQKTTKVSLHLNVEMGSAGTNGTSLQGYVLGDSSYDNIVKAFGKPQIRGAGDRKTQVEWFGKINGLSFTIYDYKSEVAPEDNIDWHIGGHNSMVYELINAYFKIKTQKNLK